MKGIYVLDACALIALLRNEPGADIIEQLIKDTFGREVKIYMNKVNLLEIYYDAYRSYDGKTADRLLANIIRLPIEFRADISDEVMREAGRLKAIYRISLADSVALAEASVLKASLLTADHHEFDVIEKSEQISFCWIR